MAWIGLRRRLSSSLSTNSWRSRALSFCTVAGAAAGAGGDGFWAEAAVEASRKAANSRCDRAAMKIFHAGKGTVLRPYDSPFAPASGKGRDSFFASLNEEVGNRASRA